MQFKFALSALLFSALAVLAAPAPCPPSDTPTPTPTPPPPPPPPSPTSSPCPPTPTSSEPATTTPASPEPSQGSGSGGGQCNSGPVTCCNTVESSDNLSNTTTSLLGFLGVEVSDLLNDVGIGCSSLVGGASCSSSTLCCENNTFNGLINIGCVPIEIAL